VPIVLKSGSLNLLEPSGPAQACNGIALPMSVRLCWLPYRLQHEILETMYNNSGFTSLRIFRAFSSVVRQIPG
jgi:hypothetical protein